MRVFTSAAALGILETDPSITGGLDDPFAPELRHPPLEWFFDPPEWFDDGTKIWVDSTGRAAGWYYEKDTCIIDGNETECWTVPPSPTGNELFHQGIQMVMDGDNPTILDVGVIGGGGEHAPAWMGPEQAAEYYADVTKQLLVGRIYDDPTKGGYFLGAVLPSVTVAQVDMIRRSSLSGDWRWRYKTLAGHNLNSYDAIGPWLVTRPGLPLNRMGYQMQRIASATQTRQIIIGSVVPLEKGNDMPWHIEHRGSEFAVVETRTDQDHGTFATIKQAETRLASLCGPVTAAVVSQSDLPIASQDLGWDGQAAEQRVQKWASTDGTPETIDWDRYAQAFFYRDDDADPQTFGAYKLGFADDLDGDLHAVPRGIFAVAGVLNGARGGVEIPEDQQTKVRDAVAAYYTRMASQFEDESIIPPWEASIQGAADMSMTDSAPDMTQKMQEINARLEAHEERIMELEGAVAELMTADLQVDDLMEV